MSERGISKRRHSNDSKELILFIRNVRKDLTSFTINLAGLSTGQASVLLICLWAYSERNVDKYPA